MVADVPETKNLIIWSWVAPVSCNSNALFICSLNGLLQHYGEQCNYCEGIVISKKALNMPKEPTVMAVHHSFIYSTNTSAMLIALLVMNTHPAIISISYLKN